jgi:hypothetical protein
MKPSKKVLRIDMDTEINEGIARAERMLGRQRNQKIAVLLGCSFLFFCCFLFALIFLWFYGDQIIAEFTWYEIYVRF